MAAVARIEYNENSHMTKSVCKFVLKCNIWEGKITAGKKCSKKKKKEKKA
jgi:hypothetical protein